ncbi:MAG: hypothetical protein WCL14_01665 [Bacteroidota bacterium]
MKNKVNGILRAVNCLLAVIGICYLYLHDALKFDFSNSESSGLAIGSYIITFSGLNLCVYMFLNSIRLFRSERVKYRFMYFGQLPFFIVFLYAFFMVLPKELSIDIITVYLFGLITVYFIVLDFWLLFIKK